MAILLTFKAISTVCLVAIPWAGRSGHRQAYYEGQRRLGADAPSYRLAGAFVGAVRVAVHQPEDAESCRLYPPVRPASSALRPHVAPLDDLLRPEPDRPGHVPRSERRAADPGRSEYWLDGDVGFFDPRRHHDWNARSRPSAGVDIASLGCSDLPRRYRMAALCPRGLYQGPADNGGGQRQASGEPDRGQGGAEPGPRTDQLRQVRGGQQGHREGQHRGHQVRRGPGSLGRDPELHRPGPGGLFRGYDGPGRLIGGRDTRGLRPLHHPLLRAD